MTVRSFTGSEGSIYSAAKDAEWQEEQIAVIMAILGMDLAAIDTVTIDEIITASRDLFPYTKLKADVKPTYHDHQITASMSAADGDARNYHHAGEAWMGSTKIRLEEVVRRAFHWRHLAKGVM
jgi:hypothetical protein